MEQDYGVIDHFLSPELLAFLRKEAQQQYQVGAFHRAGIGTGEDFQKLDRVRGDRIQWLERGQPADEWKRFWSQIDQLIRFLNRLCFLAIKRAELHFAVYPVGAFYRRHLDIFKHDQSRKFSFILYLNDGWTEADGGQLRLFLPQPGGGEKAIDILPSGGRLVCFPSDRIEHEVLAARRERFSLTGWLRDDDPLL